MTPHHAAMHHPDRSPCHLSERQIEQALKHTVQALGGLCWKFTSHGTTGVPDRICLHHGRIVFVELKAPGKKPRPIQHRRIQQLREHGFEVFVLDSAEGIREVCNALSAA